MKRRGGGERAPRAIGVAVGLFAAFGGAARAGEMMACRGGEPALAVLSGTNADDERGTRGYVCPEWSSRAAPTPASRRGAWVGALSDDPERGTYGYVAESSSYAEAGRE